MPSFSPKRPVAHGVTFIGKLFDEGTLGRAGIALEKALRGDGRADVDPGRARQADARAAVVERGRLDLTSVGLRRRHPTC
jgi:hypothetical protein